ncbi:toll/interleukin-1 receptor domain-containing protein [Pseudomonas serbica]|jgi:hypothetical protein
MKYEAFISYSHKNDRLLAKSLQRVIQTLGKPWHLVRTARIFRDETSLSATPELWPTIEEALNNSGFLLLIASREAAESKWVSKEVEWWLENKGTHTLLIILSDGTLQWNNSLGDFEKSASEALPPVLFNRFQSEPLWIDLRDWRNAKNNVSNDVQFKALASKIAARLKNIPPEDLWSEELTQQRRNLRIAGFSVATLVALLFASLWLTYFAMQQKATAQLSNMETTAQIGNHPQTLASAASLKRPYFLTNEQIQNGEILLYDALWQNRLVKTIKLNDKHTLQFEDGTEHFLIKQLDEGVAPPITRLTQTFKEDQEDQEDITEYIPPRHWQMPQGFGTWSDDRRQIRIDVPATSDRAPAFNITVTLNECLAKGDDEYRIEENSSEDDPPHLISTKELLGNTPKAIKARNNLTAPIYYVKYDNETWYLLVEIASLATMNNSLQNQEVLCALSIETQTAKIVGIYNPDLTLGLSSRIDNIYGLRQISPNARSYLEMKNGGSLTISTPPHLEDKKTLLNDLSFLPYNNDIDHRVAFSKDGNNYIVSGYRREGSWEQPYVANVDQENRIELSGHNKEVITALISDSGNTAATIDQELIARVWNLTESPMGEWLDKSRTAVRPEWIADFEIEQANFEDKGESQYSALLKELLNIKEVNGFYAATEPKCGRTIVKFGGNENSGLIGERDAVGYIGLVDLNQKRLVYSIPESDFTGEVFYFCSPEDAATFAVEFADETRGTEGI